MRFLADMGISPRVVEELRQKGHDAVHLIDENLSRLPDGDILEKAREERRVLLTHDLDFGELLAATRERLPSVVIFRLKDMRPANVSRHLFSLINKQIEALNTGAVCSVTERKVRIRSLPIEKQS
jgi:predicted nuclease of predicted toxin-antitoxin system